MSIVLLHLSFSCSCSCTHFSLLFDFVDVVTLPLYLLLLLFFCRSHDHHINIQRAIILSSFVFIDCQMCLCLSKPVCMCSHTRLSFVLFSLFIIGIHTYKQRRACKPSHLILHGSSRSQHSNMSAQLTFFYRFLSLIILRKMSLVSLMCLVLVELFFLLLLLSFLVRLL